MCRHVEYILQVPILYLNFYNINDADDELIKLNKGETQKQNSRDHAKLITEQKILVWKKEINKYRKSMKRNLVRSLDSEEDIITWNNL